MNDHTVEFFYNGQNFCGIILHLYEINNDYYALIKKLDLIDLKIATLDSYIQSYLNRYFRLANYSNDHFIVPLLNFTRKCILLNVKDKVYLTYVLDYHEHD